MAVMIVGAEKNLSQLKSRLFKGRVSNASFSKVAEAVRRANPQVDLDRLAPGTVLTIPEMPEVHVRGDLSVDEITKAAIDQVSEQFNAALQSVGNASSARAKAAKARRTRASRAIESASVKKEARSNKELGAEVKAVKQAIAAQQEVDKRNSALTKQAIRQWSKDLEDLRSLAGD